MRSNILPVHFGFRPSHKPFKHVHGLKIFIVFRCLIQSENWKSTCSLYSTKIHHRHNSLFRQLHKNILYQVFIRLHTAMILVHSCACTHTHACTHTDRQTDRQSVSQTEKSLLYVPVFFSFYIILHAFC
jgi:hypothetical protein